MIPAKLWGTLAVFQRMHFTKCLKQWHDLWASSMKYQGDHFEGDNDSKIKVVVMEK
jgi:hypothetical protein